MSLCHKLHLVYKVGLNQVLLFAVIGPLDGDEKDIDARLSGKPGRLLHLVCGPAVYKDHSHVGGSSSVPVGVAEVLLVDEGEGFPCQDTRGRQSRFETREQKVSVFGLFQLIMCQNIIFINLYSFLLKKHNFNT